MTKNQNNTLCMSNKSAANSTETKMKVYHGSPKINGGLRLDAINSTDWESAVFFADEIEVAMFHARGGHGDQREFGTGEIAIVEIPGEVPFCSKFVQGTDNAWSLSQQIVREAQGEGLPVISFENDDDCGHDDARDIIILSQAILDTAQVITVSDYLIRTEVAKYQRWINAGHSVDNYSPGTEEWTDDLYEKFWSVIEGLEESEAKQASNKSEGTK